MRTFVLHHVDEILQKIIARNAPTVANDVLRWTQRIFNYGIKRHMLETNPTTAFEIADAGSKEKSREHWLTIQAMHITKGFSRQNELTMKLLLALCCRKMELRGALWAEFDLDTAIFYPLNG